MNYRNQRNENYFPFTFQEENRSYALQPNLQHSTDQTPESNMERFLEEKRKTLEKRLIETREVFERLRDK